VIGSITPWNYPMMMAIWKIGPALAAGNTMVLKPSDTTPASTVRLGELFADVLPPGVLNIVCGDRSTGVAMSENPIPAMLAITGSIPAGKSVAAAAASRVTRVHLELGGNAPVIVFDDVDLEPAIEKIATAGLYNAGQECMAAARLLVAESRYDEVVAALAERAARQVLGDSLDPNTQLGPLVSADQREMVEGKIARHSAAAEIVTGGSRPDRSGYFLEPTVVAGVTAEEELASEETFGPVFTVQPFADEEQAIALANGTNYGLAASIWTTNAGRAMRVGSAVKAGTVWVNDHLKLAPEIAVTGFNLSGYGSENGEAGLLSVTRLKHLAISHD
jgi:betaine-aldehyde dehydrogenase